MTAQPKPLAKSLHTVTVLVAVARERQRRGHLSDPEAALDAAVLTLGLRGKPDTYGLIAAALKQLKGTTR